MGDASGRRNRRKQKGPPSTTRRPSWVQRIRYDSGYLLLPQTRQEFLVIPTGVEQRAIRAHFDDPVRRTYLVSLLSTGCSKFNRQLFQ